MGGVPKPVALVVDAREDMIAKIAKALEGSQFAVKATTSAQEALDMFYADPPRCLVIQHNTMVREGRSLLSEVKSDNVYGHLPAILVVDGESVAASVDWDEVPADDYVVEPFSREELLSRIRICWARAQRDVNANPLTGLPGNLTINHEAEHRLSQNVPFAFCYLDLDGFKAYNDKYGFSRGDEVLRMTARLVVNAIRTLGSDETYVGHIGGDDFVFITPSDLAVKACEAVTRNFDLVVRSFYDEVDRSRGCIEAKDRQGNLRHFPIAACSIGVVDTELSEIKHIAELVARVTEMKSVAKKGEGSSFVVDRRK